MPEREPGQPIADAELPGSYLFEVSWEVANQVGGIYQVLRSKAPIMTQRWGDRYLLIGPYGGSRTHLEFEPAATSGWLDRSLATLHAEGLKVHHGRWLISGKPRVLLIEGGPDTRRLDELKYTLWKDHGIESPGGDWLYDAVVGFADSVRRILEAVCREREMASPGQKPVLAHFHEWLGGLAIPMIRRKGLPIASVFTTHATLLGRYMASSVDDFYDRLQRVDDRAEATRYKIIGQHGVERACAHGAHVFTTVSSITAEECSSLLGRTCDLVTPNGLNVARYNQTHDQQRYHAEYKERINRFVMGHFFPSYCFDLNTTLYFFTSGRFEPKNKGFDLCLEAMARLNAELKAADLGITVVFFIVSRQPTRSLHPVCLEKRGVLEELSEVCERITEVAGERLFRAAAAGEPFKLDQGIEEYWVLRYLRTQHALKNNHLPMVVTHILENDQNDPVLNYIRSLGLHNYPDDPVKVVYHPDFINPANPLWGIEYDQFARGCHMGVFPSAYEPWGYTPVECLAMGVPAITSDLSGFGRFVQELYPDHDKWGLGVIKRRGRPYHESASELASRLLDYCRLTRMQRIQLRNEVDRKSWEFDWAKLGSAYHRAHELAADRFLASRRADAVLA